MVGRSLTGLTVSTKELVVLLTPSLTVTEIVLAPNWLVAGVMIKPRLVPLPPNTRFPLGTNIGLDELPVTTRLPAGVSTSPIVKAITGVTVSSGMVWPAIVEMVGASFTGFTVSTKFVLTDPNAVSVTEIVIVVVPNRFADGVIVNVRFAPLPPNTI